MGTRIPSVRDATQLGRTGVFAYMVDRDTPSRPGQTSFSWLQEVFLMDAKRAFLSAGFVFSRLTIAACAIPAGNKVHSPDSCLPTAISRFIDFASAMGVSGRAAFFLFLSSYHILHHTPYAGKREPGTCIFPEGFVMVIRGNRFFTARVAEMRLGSASWRHSRGKPRQVGILGRLQMRFCLHASKR